MTSLTPKALSLTGSGHLLIYQLGACKILTQTSSVEIHHVVGASGGAIAAAVLTQIPNRLDDYAHEFASRRGQGLSLLKELLATRPTATTTPGDVSTSNERIELHIATTRCHDGKEHMTSFGTSPLPHESEHLLIKAVEASCWIPSTFHPWDVFSSTPTTFAEHEGIVLANDDGGGGGGGKAHVDGGIATPAPPTPKDCARLIVSPICGVSHLSDRISPTCNSRGWSFGHLQAREDFSVRLCWENLRALRAAAGLISTPELLSWYQRGQDDARSYVESLEK